MVLALTGCTSPAAGNDSLRAPSEEAAQQVVGRVIDAVRRGDAQSIAAGLCPTDPVERGSLVELFLGDGHAPVAGKATPGWSGDAPVFQVELALRSGAFPVQRLVLVRAREGCVSELVDLEVRPGNGGAATAPPGVAGDGGARLPAPEEIEL